MATLLAEAPERIMDLFLTKPAFLLARVDQICTMLYAGSSPTLAQAEFLLLLAQSDDRDQVSLARASGIDTSTTALILDNLAATGLIERIADPNDRRRLRPRLTDRGRDRAIETEARHAALQAELLTPLDPPAAADLIALLRTIAAESGTPAPAWAPDEAGALAARPSLLNRRALQIAQAWFLACAAPLALTPRQYSVLVILAARPGLTQVEFSRLFGLDPSTTGLVMRNLIARGLIEDRVDARDRRKRVHTLGAAGHAALIAARPLVDAAERRTVQPFDDAQAERLGAHLRALIVAHSGRLRFPGAIAPAPTSNARA